MSLYHGTSASAAMRILGEGGGARGSDGFLYCFSSDRPESGAGALCFATGGNLRNGTIDTEKLLSQYFNLNPKFPKGLKGVFVKAALNAAISSWQKTQRNLATPPYPNHAAIIVFRDHPDAVHVSRGGFINEVKVPAKALSSLVIEKLYIDDALLSAPEIMLLKKSGIVIQPLSVWSDMVHQQAADLQRAKKNKGGPNKPKR